MMHHDTTTRDTADLLRGLLALCRPQNVLLSVPVVMLGGLCEDPAALAHPTGRVTLLIAAAVTALALAAGNVLNDLADQTEDRINRPGRPLPSGKVRPAEACLLALGLQTGSLILAGLLSMRLASPWPTGIAAVCLLLLWLYAWRGKQWPFVGNLLVALLSAAAVIYGALALGLPGGPGWPARSLMGFALVVSWIREVLKDAEDREGDQRAGRRSLPMLVSGSVLRRLLLAVACLVPLTGLLLGLLSHQWGLTWALCLLPAPLGLWAIWNWQPDSPRSAGGAQRLWKVVMLVGLLIYSVWIWQTSARTDRPEAHAARSTQMESLP
ncbi:MAG: UbiA family prenyltransferase [Calditrichaeota bacterium]|nr:UbiA family prenyltransferase [Calditrichota bacterium]MCB9474607.1 UbiA family prenyltransferase [Candidatus Delongbacteria bacterium]